MVAKWNPTVSSDWLTTRNRDKQFDWFSLSSSLLVVLLVPIVVLVLLRKKNINRHNTISASLKRFLQPPFEDKWFKSILQSCKLLNITDVWWRISYTITFLRFIVVIIILFDFWMSVDNNQHHKSKQSFYTFSGSQLMHR